METNTSLNKYREQARKTWEQIARELSEKCREYGEDPIYAHRLWCLRTGKKRPRAYELRALWDLYELEEYKE